MKSYSFKNINESESKFEIKKDDIILKDGRSVAQTYFPGRPCRVIADVNKNVGGDALLYRVAVADGKRNDIESVMVSKVTEDVVADVCVSTIEWCNGDLKDFVKIDFYTINRRRRGYAIVYSKTGKVLTDLNGSCGTLFGNIIYSLSSNNELIVLDYNDGQFIEAYKGKSDRAPYGWTCGDMTPKYFVVICSKFRGYKLYCANEHKFLTSDWCTGYDEFTLSTHKDFANKDADEQDINILAIEYDGLNSNKRIILYNADTLEQIDTEPISEIFSLRNSQIPVIKSISNPFKFNILNSNNELVLKNWAKNIYELKRKWCEYGYVIIAEYDDGTFDIVGGESVSVLENGPFNKLIHIDENETHGELICFRRSSDQKSNMISSEFFEYKTSYDDFKWSLQEWADDILSLENKKTKQIVIKIGDEYKTYYFGKLIDGEVKIFTKQNIDICILLGKEHVSIIEKLTKEDAENYGYSLDPEPNYYVKDADDISIFFNGEIILVTYEDKCKFINSDGSEIIFFFKNNTYFEEADDCKKTKNGDYIYHVKINGKWMWIDEYSNEYDENGEPM